MSEPKKPVHDELGLGKLLEAAFVIQEHRGGLPKKQDPTTETRPGKSAPQKSGSKNKNLTGSGSVSKSDRISKKSSNSEKSRGAESVSHDAQTLTLARIVETQQQILTRGLELDSAMTLVAQRAAEITKASGAAIGILEGSVDGKETDGKKPEGKKLQYCAVSGLLTLARGSEVGLEKALSFDCLRSGEVIRRGDVNADFLVDAEECRRRGIGSLIAAPIYGNGGVDGALELYFASANAFSEQDVHSCQLMAGLVTEALARDAGVASRKSLAAERATMLEALEKLRPNLAALIEGSAKESAAKSVAARASAATSAAPLPTVPVATTSAGDAPLATTPKKPAAFLCRKCGHELVGEEMFCGKCGSPRSTEYQPPTMQSKLAALWQKQQALQPTPAPVGANGGASNVTNSAAQSHLSGSVRPSDRKNNHGFPAEIQPWEAVLSELSDPFGESEPEANGEVEPNFPPSTPPRTEPAQLKKEALDISAAAEKFSAHPNSPHLNSPVEHLPVEDFHFDESLLEESTLEDSQSEGSMIEQSTIEKRAVEKSAFKRASNEALRIANVPPEGETTESDSEIGLPREAQTGAGGDEIAEETSADPAAGTALTRSHPLTWSSAAEVKEALDRLATSKNQSSFLRFWNARRGDIYLAVAVVLVAAVVRWSIASDHSSGANANAAKVSHRRPAPDADLSGFDKLMISLGLAEAPDPPEDKGNPDTQVWVDSRSALYYCPGADLYGKTPQGKYTSQRDAQLGQFEPAYRKACN